MGDKWLAFILLTAALTILVVLYQILPDQRGLLLFTTMAALAASRR